MKKKLVVLFSILATASFTLAACHGTIPLATTTPAMITETSATSTEIPAKLEYKDMTVGYIHIGSESAWRVASTASFRETAIALGIKLKFSEPSANPGNHQFAAFQQFIEDSKVNVIVISPLEATGWDELLQQAKDAGKVVILLDRRIDVPEDSYATFVGNDFVEEGRKAGKEMCKLLEENEKKSVWELAGTVGSSAAIERGMGFRETAAQCGIVITNSQIGNFSETEGKQVTEAWLKKNRDIQGIFAQNDEMGLGAIEALKEAGLLPAVEVKIVSIDATSAAFQAMLNGDLNITVECNPLLAPQVYEAALAALNGEILPKFIPTKESVFFMDDPNLKEIAAGRKY